ncbi:MAG: TRZ/ATZ family hydrolase [Proteobacteria bacterium]|nr:TRZ/ATZ family hydrolase [Pseudomonadota bacterium]
MIKQVDLIITPRWIFSAIDSVVLEKTSIVVDNGNILELIPNEIIEQKYAAKASFNLTDHLLLPGLINSHTHAAMSLFKGYADDLTLQSWLTDRIWPAEKKYVDEKFVTEGSKLAIAEMIQSGITTFNDMYFYPQQTAEVAVKIGMRANLGMVLLEFPTNYASDPDDYLTKGLAFRDLFREEGLISTSLAPHAPYSVSDESFLKINTYAQELDLKIHVHLHETTTEIEDSLKQYGLTPIQRLDALGVLGPHISAAHCVHLTNTDLDILAKNNMCVIYNPTSNLKLGSGIANIKGMIERDICIAIGTDGSASNNRLDILNELNIALLINKGVNHQADFMNPAELIKMATLNGAKSIGMEGRLGSLEKGKCADLIAVNMSSLEMKPIYDPLSSLLYSGNRSMVSHVWIGGNMQMKERALINIDVDELLNGLGAWQQKISQI